MPVLAIISLKGKLICEKLPLLIVSIVVEKHWSAFVELVTLRGNVGDYSSTEA